jgi:hypothetical protein
MLLSGCGQRHSVSPKGNAPKWAVQDVKRQRSSYTSTSATPVVPAAPSTLTV